MVGFRGLGELLFFRLRPAESADTDEILVLIAAAPPIRALISQAPTLSVSIEKAPSLRVNISAAGSSIRSTVVNTNPLQIRLTD